MAEVYKCGCVTCIHNRDEECYNTGVVIDYVKIDGYDVLTCASFSETREEEDE